VDILFVLQEKNVVVCVRGGETVVLSALGETSPTSSIHVVENIDCERGDFWCFIC
jgi:hypothetical protein